MKKIILGLTAVCLTTAAAFAQEARFRRMFISLGLADTVMGANFIGGNFSFGFHFSPNSLLTAETNAGFYNSGKIGSYEYGYFPLYDQHEGKITYEYLAIEFLVSWYHVGKISNKFQYRIGPSAGLLAITGSDAYDPAEKDGRRIRGIPESTSETNATVTAGAGAGLIWNITGRMFLDLGYRVMINPGIKFEEKTLRILGTDIKVKEKEFDKIQHQASLSAGWRF